jgi:LmbE family N-acetylglucosaminyl deacetylase
MSPTLVNADAEIFVPDGSAAREALRRTTQLGVGAHPDDLEIFAIAGILECFQRDDEWFTGVVVTDGAGSPRHGRYRAHTDERMRALRRIEQKKAAFIGSYSAQVLLDHQSSQVKGASRVVVEDLKQVLEASAPRVVYTHSLTDKHDTHVAVALRVLQACREVSSDCRPTRLLGCEVWRDLDWLCDADKAVMNLDQYEHLELALVGVFDSQIAGGKRYDLATLGRRRAHATFSSSHAIDDAPRRVYAMDLSALLHDRSLDPVGHSLALIDRFRDEVEARLRKLS